MTAPMTIARHALVAAQNDVVAASAGLGVAKTAQNAAREALRAAEGRLAEAAAVDRGRGAALASHLREAARSGGAAIAVAPPAAELAAHAQAAADVTAAREALRLIDCDVATAEKAVDHAAEALRIGTRAVLEEHVQDLLAAGLAAEAELQRVQADLGAIIAVGHTQYGGRNHAFPVPPGALRFHRCEPRPLQRATPTVAKHVGRWRAYRAALETNADVRPPE